MEVLDKRANEAEAAEAELVQELRQAESIAADRSGLQTCPLPPESISNLMA